MPNDPQEILKNVFGYDEFKPLQREVIQNILQKKDTLTIMPTGGGKSLCYQIPALIFPGLTVVVSPLISLMKDQVEQLDALGVPAVFLNSSLTASEYQHNTTKIRSGKAKLLYVAPETLLMPRLLNLLTDLDIDCIAIDEAHCISAWGHDFRPEYRQLAEVRKRFPKAVSLGFTATATPRVRQDIKQSLNFDDSNEFIASFNRENLLIEVRPKSDPFTQTLDFLKRFPDQSGIIYCFSRRQVDELAMLLKSKGHNVRPYHAGLPNPERQANQETFIRDDVNIIVATIAFGMGINKPDVRFVIHYDLPKSIEGYYQEIGRAGRDGLPAHCLLLYSHGDTQKQRFFINQKEPAEQKVANQQLEALVQFAESDQCRRKPLLAYFGEKYPNKKCDMCDICLGEKKNLVDITIPAQKFLSCVKRTGEMFGAAHVTDVLRGSKNKKVLKFGHEKLSTYNIGGELSRDQWIHISRQLVQKGLLAKDPQHQSLKITPQGYTALKNKDPIMGLVKEEQHKLAARKQRGAIDHDHKLFEQLRAKRKQLADSAGVPPYVIFSDRTLTEMAAYFPTTKPHLLNINGVGQTKLERYGETFINIIQDYCTAHNITPNVNIKPAPPSRRRRSTSVKYLVYGEAFNSGKSVKNLMADFQVKQSTVLKHLTDYALEGNPLRPDHDIQALSKLSDQQKEKIYAAFKTLGTDLLKPIHDEFNKAIPYDDLHILRLHYLGENSRE